MECEGSTGKSLSFDGACLLVESEMAERWDSAGFDAVEFQKRAIIGYESERQAMIAQICGILQAAGSVSNVPEWYTDIESGVFHEIWGLAGLAEWFQPEWRQSSSAKIIGENIFFMAEGDMCRMPQKISPARREQLIRALLLLSPEERMDKAFHELYMVDGTRVTIFREGLAKKGQEALVFRRYIVPDYSFEEQAVRGTIPSESIPLFENMVKVGYNVVFCGSVRSAKTTFLSTWQRYEDPKLEGVMVETDPEIPLHALMPGAPLVQLLADGTSLSAISRNLLRSDADYFILAEARDGIALDTAVRIARKGTRRMKMTFHCREPYSFPSDAAMEIVRSLGGDAAETAKLVAGSFDYLFHFVNLRGEGKRLKGIFEMGLAWSDGRPVIEMHEICRYDRAEGRWRWCDHISADKRRVGEEADADAFLAFADILKSLSGENPMDGCL